MLSTILWNGRYIHLSFILPCAHSASIESACHLYTSAMAASKLHDEKSEKGLSLKVLKEKITRKYGYPLFELCHQYHNMQDWLLKSVIFSHSGLLTRRMLIFPTNEGHTHWIVTFVFNPSFIDEQDGETNSGKMLWPCFLVL